MIDIHAHIWGKNIEGSKRSILDAMDRYEIGRVYVSGLQDLISDVNQIDYLNNCVASFYPRKFGQNWRRCICESEER